MTEALGNGSYLIDTALYRPRHTACYLVEDAGELAIIDTGTQNSLPHVLDAIATVGATVDQVRYVIPTHVHLDHAGGAGALMQACPNATLIVHPKGLPHMIDPGKLQAGATAVYGDEAFQRDFGDLEPIPSSARGRVGSAELRPWRPHPAVSAHPGACQSPRLRVRSQQRLSVHRRHLWTRLPEFRQHGEPLLVATTTPVAFDPDAWLDSLDRMMACAPAACCLAHFGKVEQPQRHVAMLRDSIGAHVAIALTEEQQAAEGREGRLRQAVDRLLVGAGTAHSDLSADQVRHIFDTDIELNAQGLHVWLMRRAKRRE